MTAISMRVVLTLLRKDFLHFWRNKPAVFFAFAVPLAMIYLFGQIFGVNKKDSGPNGIPLAVVNASSNPAAEKLIDALKTEKSFRVITEFDLPDKTKRPLVEDDLRPMMQAAGARIRFALVIPADVVGENRIGLRLKILSNPRNEIETKTVDGLLQKTIFSNVPELLGQSLNARAKDLLGETRFKEFTGAIASAVSVGFGADEAEIERLMESGDFGFSTLTDRSASTRLPLMDGDAAGAPVSAQDDERPADVFSQIVRIEREQVVGANIKSPVATGLIGGWAIQFLLFSLNASVAGLFRERDTGIFQRVLAAPVSRAQILWSKFFFGVAIGVLQLVALFIAGGAIYGIEVLPHLHLLTLVCVFAAAACTAFAMLVTALVPNAEAASGLATFVIMLMSAVGGAWFPLTFLPAFIQQISKFTLVYWSMEGFSAVLWAGQGFVQILPIIGVLAGIAAGVMTIAIWRFNRGKIFD
jgi:ABC-2 type transport system permease protein